MSVYDANRLPHKLIKNHNNPLCVTVKCSRCSKEYKRKISELMIEPVNICNCDYDIINNKAKDVVNFFEPYYMDYRILILKNWSINKSANKFKRRKQLKKYINQFNR